MKREPPDLDAPAEEWREFIRDLHDCMDRNFDAARGRNRWNLGGIAAILTVVLGLTVTVVGLGVAGVRWTYSVDQRLTTIQASVNTHSDRLNHIDTEIRQVQCVTLIDKQVSQEAARTICGVSS